MGLSATRSIEPAKKLIVSKLAFFVLAVLSNSTAVAQNPSQDNEDHQRRKATSEATFMGVRRSFGDAGLGLSTRKAATKNPSLYHIGAKGFFLDHKDKLTFSAEQIYALSLIRARSSSLQSSAKRDIDYEEHQLWLLTSDNQPNKKNIEAKVRKIEKLRAARRLAFIHAVGESVNVLTAQQKQLLTENQSTTKVPNPTSP